jgi:hypothetical protein
MTGEQNKEPRPQVRHVVKDLNTAVRLKQVQTRAEERKRRDELRAEVRKIRLKMSAREAASKHIAVFGPLYLLLLVAMFLGVLATGVLAEDQVPVVAALLTLLVTTIGANLRSIISEAGQKDSENEHHE